MERGGGGDGDERWSAEGVRCAKRVGVCVVSGAAAVEYRCNIFIIVVSVVGHSGLSVFAVELCPRLS